MKSYRQAKAGQQLSGIVSYLNDAAHQRVQPHPVAARPAVVDINDLASLVEIYKMRAAKWVHFHKIQKKIVLFDDC